MIITDNYIFVNLPKTGTVWTTHALKAVTKSKRICQTHDPISKCPEEYFSNRKIVGNVRNPLSWYVSLYCHGGISWKGKNKGLLSYGQGTQEWKKVLWGMTHLSEIEPIEPFGVVWHPDITKEQVKESKVGLCTLLHHYMYGKDGLDIALRTEYLPSDLYIKCGINALDRPPLNIRHDIDGRKRVPEPYGPKDYLEWYDDEMLQWVEDADGPLRVWVSGGATIGKISQ